MYGKSAGNNGGSECHSLERTFFNTVKKNKHSFFLDHTLNARKSFLGNGSADPVVVNQILSIFSRSISVYYDIIFHCSLSQIQASSGDMPKARG